MKLSLKSPAFIPNKGDLMVSKKGDEKIISKRHLRSLKTEKETPEAAVKAVCALQVSELPGEWGCDFLQNQLPLA